MLAGGSPALTATGFDFGRIEALTFDCYGTLIDWEAGILAGLRPSLRDLADQPSDDELLEQFARAEATIEAGPYRRYREVLGRALQAICGNYGVAPGEEAAAAFGASVGEWPAFPD